jgi:hypothetical protein
VVAVVLHVDRDAAALRHPPHQAGDGDLRRAAGQRELRVGGEHAADPHAERAADELVAVPHLHAVRVPGLVQGDQARDEAVGQPPGFPADAALPHDAFEAGVHGGRPVDLVAQLLAEAALQVELVDEDHRARVGRAPRDRVRVGALPQHRHPALVGHLAEDLLFLGVGRERVQPVPVGVEERRRGEVVVEGDRTVGGRLGEVEVAPRRRGAEIAVHHAARRKSMSVR